MASYLLKITLQKTPCLIWRRFVVPSFITLNRLNEVIQSVMGWENKRPHYFSVNKQRFVPNAEGLLDGQPEGLPEAVFSLDDVVFRSGSHLKYIYGEINRQWTHLINVENPRFSSGNCPYPIYCTEGVRACPPEQCSTSEEFAAVLNGLKNPLSPEYTELSRQYAGFAPDKFDIETVNKKFSVPADFLIRNDIAHQQPTASTRKKGQRIVPQPDILHQLGLKLKRAL